VYSEIVDSGERILLLIDDCVNDIAKNRDVSNLLSKMMMNRRHICGRSDDDGGAGLSCWLTTQVYNKLPRSLRATASHHIIFKTSNKKELATIFDELILLDHNNFKKLYSHVFDSAYNFLFINIDATQDRMYSKNLNQLVLDFNEM